MAYDLPGVPIPGDVATVSNWAQKVIDSLTFLHGRFNSVQEFVPAAAGTSGTSPSDVTIGGFSARELADGLLEIVEFTWRVPNYFNSLSSIQAVWLTTLSTGNDMYWRINLTGMAGAGEDYTSNADVPAYGVTAGGGNDIINVQPPDNLPTYTNIAPNDYVTFTMQRDGTNVADTLGASAFLLGMLFTFNGNTS